MYCLRQFTHKIYHIYTIIILRQETTKSCLDLAINGSLNSYIFYPIIVKYKILEFVDNGLEIGRVSGRALRYIMSSLNFPELIFGDGQRYRGLEKFGVGLQNVMSNLKFRKCK